MCRVQRERTCCSERSGCILWPCQGQNGNPGLEQGKALLKKNGSPAKLRIWRAGFAGPETGSVVVSMEFESLQVLAAEMAKLADNAEFQTWLKGLDEIRTILSDSIYREL